MARQGPVLLGRRRREAAIRAHVAAATAALAALPKLPKAADAIAAARTQLGLPYAITGCRCSPSPCGARDCSGEIYYGINVVSGTDLCGSSFGLAQIGAQHNTIIPKAQALVTPGAIGILNPWGSPNAIGSNGHTWWCVGDGIHSIEEGGRATGCYEGLADKDGPGGVIYILWPGFDYSTRITEVDMFVQQFHYDQAGKPIGPCQSPVPQFDSIVRVADDGLSILGCYGASIDGDQPDDPKNIYMIRRWHPANPLPPGAVFTGVAPKEPTGSDPRPAGVATVSDGTTRRFHLS